MKAIVTGGHQGLGLAIQQRFIKANWQVSVESRRSGFDITQNSNREELIERTKTIDAFINNAQAEFAQTELLLEIVAQWEKWSKEAIIINIGSQAVYDFTSRPQKPMIYDYQKLALKEASLNLSKSNLIKITHVDLGYMNTPRILNNPLTRDRAQVSVDYVAEVILWLCEQPKEVMIPHLYLRPRGSDKFEWSLNC